MKIEWVTRGSVDEAVELGREMHAESRFTALPFDADRLRKSFVGAIDDDRGVYFLALARSSGGDAAGGLFGTVEKPYFTSGVLAHDYAFYVRPDFRGSSAALKLLSAFRRWAQKRGARELHVYQTVAVDSDRFDRMMRRAGFEYAGGNYIYPLV